MLNYFLKNMLTKIWKISDFQVKIDMFTPKFKKYKFKHFFNVLSSIKKVFELFK